MIFRSLFSHITFQTMCMESINSDNLMMTDSNVSSEREAAVRVQSAAQRWVKPPHCPDPVNMRHHSVHAGSSGLPGAVVFVKLPEEASKRKVPRDDLTLQGIKRCGSRDNKNLLLRKIHETIWFKVNLDWNSPLLLCSLPTFMWKPEFF